MGTPSSTCALQMAPLVGRHGLTAGAGESTSSDERLLLHWLWFSMLFLRSRTMTDCSALGDRSPRMARCDMCENWVHSSEDLAQSPVSH